MKPGSVLFVTMATACLILILQSSCTHARAFEMDLMDERETDAGFEKTDSALRNTLKSLILRRNNEDRIFSPVEEKRGGSKSIDYAEDMVKFALWCRKMHLDC